ncbi:UDP-N-acetylmuramoyl-tripeptide--D-alanyl-D-alanine ligase [Marinobacterium lutimaris]|uniref:UDP-N-acetylmuramoyl-tripeptide--D-alanyl-D-alanine ligase n=1 Tax=Marinobacterium lutimaris TaxID=568106 RepID=A0A1H6CD88_9GAMM|nr:UDP-N-acetylmuramoyl-tripeptide--D-alanyl-D-alanine ligase [Marinobacterium lutimaris]SEG70803.1 UDP-N-acetylmuramoyl-tripeptide--D-alanyl-D-alanine ligase [Marinobacterium lutimaris]
MIADFSLNALAQVLNAEFAGKQAVPVSRRVCTDTRKVEPGDLFLALKGPRFDAHDYVGDAVGKGAVAAVVDHSVDPEVPQLVVADTLKALGMLGGYNRQAFPGLLFAVTGSSGKTTVKEMLASMLATLGETLATRGNLNNEIGVPLTLLELEPRHQYAVIELGASGLGEIAYTTALAKPKVAILTNAQGAHLEGFGSLENIVRAKSEIYEGLTASGVGVVNLDDPHADFWLKKLNDLGKEAVTFGVDNPAADLNVRNARIGARGSWGGDLNYRGETQALSLAVLGRHNLANAAAAAAAWVAAGLPLEGAVAGLEAFRAVPGRLCPHILNQGALLIDDSYNANPGAVKAAIDVLMDQPGPHTLLLGDMAELGDEAAQLHAEVGQYAGAAGVERLLTTGVLSQQAAIAAAEQGSEAKHFARFEDLLSELEQLDLTAGTLLAKGSRSAGMERAVKALVTGE